MAGFLRKSAKVAHAAVSLEADETPYWLSQRKAEDIVTQCKNLDAAGHLGSQKSQYTRMRVLRAHNQKLQRMLQRISKNDLDLSSYGRAMWIHTRYPCTKLKKN